MSVAFVELTRESGETAGYRKMRFEKPGEACITRGSIGRYVQLQSQKYVYGKVGEYVDAYVLSSPRGGNDIRTWLFSLSRS
jgi:hypothetical protein